MPLFEYPELACVQITWLIGSGFWMLRRNDEIPLLISFLLFYVTGYRYWAVTNGLNDWVNLGQFGIAPITQPETLSALSYLVLAQSFFLAAYIYCQKHKIPVVETTQLSPFLSWLRPKIIMFGLFCLPLVMLTRGSVANQIRSGRSAAFSSERLSKSVSLCPRRDCYADYVPMEIWWDAKVVA